MAQKLFRDPLYDYISVDTRNDAWLLRLINCPEVQRLRYIKQLGLSHLTYPGSTHSRFSHCLGVYHLMKECVRYLRDTHGTNVFKAGEREALLAAALLHDIGHGPFSHATEKIFGDHEVRSVQIISSVKSGVNQILSEVDRELLPRVAALVAKKAEKDLPEPVFWQKSLVSSQLDMDRLDYLRRDSMASGAEYGHFDWFRIVHTMNLQKKTIKGRQKEALLVWPDKTKYALEEYIFSRFYMYQSVYFHHTTRGFEGLLQKILQCAKSIAEEDNNFAKGLLPPMKVLVEGKGSKASARFQALTDYVLLAQIALWEKSRKRILSDLCRRFLKRKGIAWIEILQTPMVIADKTMNVREYLRSKRINDKYYFFGDETQATAYKPYSSASTSEEQSSVNSIILYESSWPQTGFREITEMPGLERLQAITKGQSSVLRYYFPKEYEREIRKMFG